MPDRAGRDALGELQSQLRALWPERDEGWVDADDLHLTLRFLGDLPAPSLEAALATLQLPESEPQLVLRCTGVELWPGVRPRLAVARFEDDRRMADWVAALERWAVDFGLPTEGRLHAPHVTLLRAPKPLTAPAALPAAGFPVHFSAVQAMHRSEHARGPRYEAHAEYPLL